MVNTAIYLRRPLLVTGLPGVGKSSLAHAVAYELGLGDVLVWPITSRSTREQGLYDYDAVARFQNVALAAKEREARPQQDRSHKVKAPEEPYADIGRYITLGPLGTAFALSAQGQQSVVLIDELDKSDIDLPNDLLHLFEEGCFEITEIARVPERERTGVPVRVRRHGGAGTVEVPADGMVRCADFPVVVITSNGERAFPPAFLRRCLRLDIPNPDRDKLRAIIKAHLALDLSAAPEDARETEREATTLLDHFLQLRDQGADGNANRALATDQLLNALHLIVEGIDLNDKEREGLRADIFKALAES